MPPKPSEPIFISYSRRDTETMRQIAFFLRDRGYKVWVDNEKLIPGTAAWEESIEMGIKQAFAVVVILSPDSKNSEWVRREIAYADQFEKPIFPALIRGDEEESLPLRLVTRQYVDLRKDDEAGLLEIEAAIGFYLGKKRTMEMKRPPVKEKMAGASDSVAVSKPAPVSSQNKKTTNAWILLPRGLLVFCVLIFAAFWIGYRMLSSQPTETASLLTASETAVPTSNLADTVAPGVSAPLSDVVARYLTDVQITDADPFDVPQTGKWNLFKSKVENGALTIIGNANYDGVFASQEFRAGEGVVIDFKYSPDATVEIFLDHGLYGEPTYQRFGIYVEGSRIYVNEYGGGNKDGSGLSGNLVMKPDTAYSILIAYLPNGELLEALWDTADPTKTLAYREKMDSTWLDLALTFFIQAGSGTVEIDNFIAIKFSGAR